MCANQHFQITVEVWWTLWGQNNVMMECPMQVMSIQEMGVIGIV